MGELGESGFVVVSPNQLLELMTERPHPSVVVDIHENAEVMQVLFIPEIVDVQTLGTCRSESPTHSELQEAVRPENIARKTAQTGAQTSHLAAKGEIQGHVEAERSVEQPTDVRSVQLWGTKEFIGELLGASTAREGNLIQNIEVDIERRVFENDDLPKLVIPNKGRSEAYRITPTVMPVHPYEGVGHVRAQLDISHSERPRLLPGATYSNACFETRRGAARH